MAAIASVSRALSVAPRLVAAAPAAASAAPRRLASSVSAPTRAFSLVTKRNAIYISYIVVGAIVLETAFGTVMDKMWLSINAGVSPRRRSGGSDIAKRTRITRLRVCSRDSGRAHARALLITRRVD